MEMKYIRHSKAGFVLWPRIDSVFHCDVARAVLTAVERETDEPGTIVSAGFAELTAQGRFRCWGKSESLGIASKTDDTDALNVQLLGTFSAAFSPIAKVRI